MGLGSRETASTGEAAQETDLRSPKMRRGQDRRADV